VVVSGDYRVASEQKGKEEAMTELARFVAAAIQDRAVEDVLRENRRLQGTIDQFRQKIRHVDFQWAGPNFQLAGPQNDDDTDPRSNFVLYKNLRLDLSTANQEAFVLRDFRMNDNGIPVVFRIPFDVFLRSEIRFGDFFVTTDCELTFSLSLLCIVRDPDGRPPLKFHLKLNREFIVSSGEMISIEGYFADDISIEQCAELLGQSIEQINSKYNIAELEDGRHRVSHKFSPARVNLDVVTRVLGGDVVLNVCTITCPFGLIKKKCHLL